MGEELTRFISKCTVTVPHRYWAPLALAVRPRSVAAVYRRDFDGPHRYTSRQRALDAFLNLDDFIGFQAMSFAVDHCCCLFAGSSNQAENLTTVLIKPIPQVLYAVLFLRLEICLMRVHNCICGQTFDVGMDFGTPVVEDYANKMPFEFSGKLQKLTIELK